MSGQIIVEINNMQRGGDGGGYSSNKRLQRWKQISASTKSYFPRQQTSYWKKEVIRQCAAGELMRRRRGTRRHLHLLGDSGRRGLCIMTPPPGSLSHSGLRGQRRALTRARDGRLTGGGSAASPAVNPCRAARGRWWGRKGGGRLGLL